MGRPFRLWCRSWQRAASTVVLVSTTVAGAAMSSFVAATPAHGAPPRCATPSQEMVRDTPWTQRRLAPSRVWPLTRGEGVTVAIIDTGVDGAIRQLAGRVLPGIDIVNGTGPANTDCFGHGTFVAGIIAAQPQVGTGLAGIAPGVTILPVRQANDASDGTSSGLARAIRAATDAGARVVNISASAFFPNEELRLAVEYAADHDVVLVAAAANEAQSGNPKSYPAAYPQVIAVGSIGEDGQRSDFSEVGSFLDLVAPGVDVISLSRAGIGHLVDNGTSYASPFVSAVAALVRSYYPRLTAAQVKRRLELTADHPGTTLPDPELGWGVVNPYQAVTMVLPEEQGAKGTSGSLPPLSAIIVAAPDTTAPEQGVQAATYIVTGTVGACLLAYLLPRGTRRRWRARDQADPIAGER